ncbi:MAG: hypothetical protein QOE11_3635 [Solirubrobacteraceae bacterium]|jgi:hypothetical protein|nr:hypothetical protein [Solirubrobacteraceae bacterium]
MAQHDAPDQDALDQDDFGQVAGEPPLTHEGMPISGWHFGEPIPDLDRIPQERWREALAPLRRGTRQMARAHCQSDVQAAGILIGELMLEDGEATWRAMETPPPAMPRAGAPPSRRSAEQVNFRLTADEHQRLVTAARIYAMRPTALARLLTVRGVDRALHEHRRDG